MKNDGTNAIRILLRTYPTVPLSIKPNVGVRALRSWGVTLLGVMLGLQRDALSGVLRTAGEQTMNLDPTLRRPDRIGSLVAGAAFVAYAFLGGFEQAWVRVVLIILGLMLAVGGIGGT